MSKLQFKIQRYLIFTVLFLLPFYFIKFEHGWLSLNLVEILILALAAVWFWNNGGGWIKHKDWKKYQWPVALVLAGVISSIFINKNYHMGLGIFKGWFLLPIIFAIVVLDNLKKNEKLLNWSLAALFYGGVLVAIEGIYYWFSGLMTFDGRLRIFFDSPNQLAMYLAPIFLIGMYKVRLWGILRREAGEGKGRTLENSWKLLLAGMILIALNLYLTKSFGAWLALAVVLGVIFWLKQDKKEYKKYSATVIVILIILASFVSFSKFESIKNLGERSSLASRVMIWKSAGLMVEKNPVFGIGPGNFQNMYLEYQKYFPPYLEWAVPQPHNLFLAFWLEAGLTGLVGFIWLIIIFFRDNKKVYPLTKTDGLLDASAYRTKKQDRESLLRKNNFGDGDREKDSQAAWLCFAIILYFLFHGLVDTTYWRNDMAILFWVIIVINSWLVEKSWAVDKNKVELKAQS
jgi:O-antigen ligase